METPAFSLLLAAAVTAKRRGLEMSNQESPGITHLARLAGEAGCRGNEKTLTF